MKAATRCCRWDGRHQPYVEKLTSSSRDRRTMATALALTIVLLAALSGTHGSRYGCPTRLQITPCLCQDKSSGLDVTCENGKIEQLTEALHNVGQTKQLVAYLKLRNNNLVNLPVRLLYGLYVRHLTAHHCNLSSIDNEAFSTAAERLESLDLSQNAFEKVPSHALENLAVLVSLNMNYNKLEILHAEAFKGLVSLLRLSLYGNKIKFIDNLAFVGVGTNLTRIDLGANHLSAVPSRPLRNLTVLQRLQLHENHVTALMSEEFGAMGESLDVLELSGNRVQELPSRAFMSLKMLQSLDLENNLISSIHTHAFYGMEDSLEWLKLGENKLDTIPSHSLKNLTKLKQLDLRGNNISQIRENDFKPYGKKLRYIYLQENWLTDIDTASLKDLDSLHWLYLHTNQLVSLPQETYSPILNQLEQFDIHNNPFHCDCQIIWFRNWLLGENGSRIIRHALETRCRTPEEYKGMAIQDIPKDELELQCPDGTTQHHPDDLVLLTTFVITCVFVLHR